MEPVDKCFKRLQGLTTIISEQDSSLLSLASSLRALLVMEGRSLVHPLAAKGTSGDDSNVLGAKVATTTSHAADFISDLGSFAKNCHGALEQEEARAVDVGIGKMFLARVEKKSAIPRSATPATAQAQKSCRLNFRTSLRSWLQDDIMTSCWSKVKSCGATGKVWKGSSANFVRSTQQFTPRTPFQTR
jgi:hypothetical protein